MALVLPLTAVLLVATAPAAAAAVQSPASGTIFGAHTRFEISAKYQFGASELRLTPPGGAEVQIAEGPSSLGEQTLRYGFSTMCWNGTRAACSADQPAPNGVWRVRQTGGTTGEAFFRLKIPAQAPTAVAAAAESFRDVRVSWRRTGEPDLTGFAVFEGDGAVRQGLVPADVCDAGGTCSTVISYPEDGTGEHTYTVRAFRADGAGGVLSSAPSDSASATLTAPAPSPQPSPDTSPGPGGEGAPIPGPSGSPGPGASGAPGSGGDSTGGDQDGTGSTAGEGGGSKSVTTQAAARRQAFSSGFNAFGPKLGIPKLPPLPKPQAPSVAELPDGTFEPTLGFEDQVLRERVEPTGVGRVTDAVGNVLDSEQLARSAAGALVLLLAGAHLRRWLGATTED